MELVLEFKIFPNTFLSTDTNEPIISNLNYFLEMKDRKSRDSACETRQF